MIHRCLHVTAIFAVLAAPLRAEPPVIDAVSTVIRQAIETHEIAGAVTLVADETAILHLAADGMADIADEKPMTTDALFWIASMTKPITATAVMMMQEEGKLSVDDPVSKYLPEFAGDKAAITIAQCLIHSSGLAELSGAEARDISTLAELTKIVAEKPLQFAPGSKWQYCQTGINTAARVVEVVSGKSFPEFLQQRVFDPLGMKDTTFYPTEAQVARLAKSYKRTDDGKLEEVSLSFLLDRPATARVRYPMANGGLFSSARDYAKFAQMILRGGEFDGKRYLKPESVTQMTTVQSGDLTTGFTPGNAWGLGWCVVREPQGVSGALSPGSFGHGGAFGTQAWIDPTAKRIFLLMVQRANFPNSDASAVRRAFQDAAVSTK